MDSDHYFDMSCAGEEAGVTPGRNSAHHRVRDPVAGVTRRGFGPIRSQRIEVRALTRGAGCPQVGWDLSLIPLTTEPPEQRYGWRHVLSVSEEA